MTPKPDLRLPDRLTKIVEADYPRFSAAELKRRRTLMAEAMTQAGVDHLIIHAAFFRGGAVHWLTDWLTTYEAVVVLTPGRDDTLFIQFFNHLPQARELMPHLDIRWGGESTIATAIEELKHRHAATGRVGFAGFLPPHYVKALAASFGEPKDLNRPYIQQRMIKSDEEIDFARIAARLSDMSVEAMQKDIRPGMDERDVGAIIQAAFLPWRGTDIIHFLSTTPMQDPQVFVPRQHPLTRKLQKGDVISCEITASFWEHWGQTLRTMTLGEPPTPLYRRLHDVAEQAFDAIFAAARPGARTTDLLIGARLIEKEGFSFYDDLVHGFGGGYLPPIIGSPLRENGPLSDFELRPGMMLVIQPNVIDMDRRAGVQMGELVVITETGAETLHTIPRTMSTIPVN
jgi:Xaa-Pro aminopeptidase